MTSTLSWRLPEPGLDFERGPFVLQRSLVDSSWHVLFEPRDPREPRLLVAIVPVLADALAIRRALNLSGHVPAVAS